MKAILEFDVPESCVKCRIAYLTYDIFNYYQIACNFVECASIYIETRHPDCPLKIVEDDLRREEYESSWENSIICPKCNLRANFPTQTGWAKEHGYNYCPSCGIKLLPPIE